MNIIQIISILVVLIMIGVYLISKMYNNIKLCIIKINSIENEIDSTLREKYDLLNNTIIDVKQKDSKENIFKDIDKIKDEELSSFEFERKLADIENDLKEYINNNDKLKKEKSLVDSNNRLININTKINANIKLYNNTITDYNLLTSKLSTKLICLIFKFKEKKYFDNKDMNDENIKDFKI